MANDKRRAIFSSKARLAIRAIAREMPFTAVNLLVV